MYRQQSGDILDRLDLLCVHPPHLRKPDGPNTAEKLKESIRQTLRDLENNTELPLDSPALADLKKILLLRLAELEAETVDKPSL